MDTQSGSIKLSKSCPPTVEKWYRDIFTERISFKTELQITYIKQGRGYLYVSDKAIPYEKGDLYIFGQNLGHSVKSSKYPDEHVKLKRSKAISLFFDQDKINESLQNLPEAYGIKKLINFSNYGVKLSKNNSKYLKVYVKKLAKSSGLEKFILFLKFLDSVSKDNNVLILSSKAAPDYLGSEYDPKIGKIYDFVKKNYKEEITLKQISEIANMSPTGFCRFFKMKTRKTFSEYLATVRVNKACKLLRNNDYSILDCCYDSGHNNLPNFHKHFKKTTGMSALEYRFNHINNKVRDFGEN